MTEYSLPKISEFYDGKKRATNIDLAKFALMPFVFFALLGFPSLWGVGDYISAFSNFAALSFFIFCGFFTLTPNKEKRIVKLKRAVKRSFIFFAVLFLAYIVFNVTVLAVFNSLGSLTDPEFLRFRTVFNFLVLNVWPLPIGKGIWFIQSLLYAYVFFFVAEKLKLYKTYVPVLVVLLIFMILTGELAAVSRFQMPGGFLTKAIPFMLIGMLIRKYVDKLAKIPRFVYIITFFGGILFALGEFFLLRHFGLLVYTGNFVGYGVMAISFCCFAISDPFVGQGFLGTHSANYARRMYALCQPVSFLSWLVSVRVFPTALATVMEFNSFLCLVICFVLAFFIGLAKFKILRRIRKRKNKNSKSEK